MYKPLQKPSKLVKLNKTSVKAPLRKLTKFGWKLGLFYLADMFITNLKTKFNSSLQNGFKYQKKIHKHLFTEIFP